MTFSRVRKARRLPTSTRPDQPCLIKNPAAAGFFCLNHLDEDSTLACFGSYYRDDGLKFPDGTDHGNIRRFMRDG